ncbi:hypothetical protein [Mesorhizobium abyssinicae]|uniref:hypothetical protein n=1 Tax=Mesorhizobium abyssinicae TaxID=1209958 RepID=UPI003394B6B6
MRVIGLLAPDSDPIIERDIWNYACRFDFDVVTTRIPLPQPYTTESGHPPPTSRTAPCE